MNRWTIYVTGFVLVGLISAGGYLYLKFEPKHHFSQLEVPVLSEALHHTEQTLNKSEKSEEEDQPEQKSSSGQAKVYKAFNVLVLGIDTRGNENSRTDVMMVLHIIPSERKVNIISIPRDTRVHIDGVGFTKINHAHILGEMKGGNEEGTKAAIDAVSNFLNAPINYYIKTNFEGFEDFIDTIGGVDVQVTNEIYLSDRQVTIPSGLQHINGKLALSLVRERYSNPDGDFGRQSEQSQILKNVAQQILKPENIGEIANLLTKVKKDIVDTNFHDDDLISLAWLFKGMSMDEFTYKQIPGQSGYELDPLVQMRLYYWIPDSDEVKRLSDYYLKDIPRN